ncbi:hypothetical protein Mal65_01810 [Crateriforma conspicua]|nr:hypothetical protein Mal65_01810 [Crateriforma conspicua]
MRCTGDACQAFWQWLSLSTRPGDRYRYTGLALIGIKL